MKPLTDKQRHLLALIPDDAMLLWLVRESRFAVVILPPEHPEIRDIGKGWGPTLESLYYRCRLNNDRRELPAAYRLEWQDARRFEVAKVAKHG